jgi:subtilisin family serine protease
MFKNFLFLSLTTGLVLSSCQTGVVTPVDVSSESSSIFDFEGKFENGTPIEGQYIVIFEDNAFAEADLERAKTYTERTALVKTEALNVLETIKSTNAEVLYAYGNALKGFAVKADESTIEKLRLDERVRNVEQDKFIVLGGKGKPGGGGTPPAQTTPWGITRVGSADGTGKRAWIIDSGIDMDHADLNVDQTLSQSFLSGGGGNTSPDDQNGHGTHVAGTVGAINNTIGVVGVAPNAALVAVRVLDRRGSGSTSGVIAGVNYVAANGVSGDVATMSLGGGVSTTLDNAVINAASSSGVKFVLAAGNESDDANNHSPARANGTNVYTISAMDINDNWAYFSNYGTPVDYCAPGVSINSTWKDGGYNTISGTSMACPHAAGVILLGNWTTNGTVNGDPDGNADAIIVH